MAFPSCDILTINSQIPGSLQNMSDLETEAAIVTYLYRRQNPATVGQIVPVNTLRSSSVCLDCGVSENQRLAFEAWMERQAAIDAGANVGAFNASQLKFEMQCLTCLPMSSLRAMEILLRCQLS